MCKNCEIIESIRTGASAPELDACGEIIECESCGQKWLLDIRQGNHYHPPKEGCWYCYLGYKKVIL